MRSEAILMVGGQGYAGTVNPLKPHDHWLYDSLVGMVMQKARGYSGQPSVPEKLELWTGAGDKPYYIAGERVEAHHDQSGRTKGQWVCVGAVKWHGDDRPAEVLFGEVPSKKIKHGVYK